MQQNSYSDEPLDSQPTEVNAVPIDNQPTEVSSVPVREPVQPAGPVYPNRPPVRQNAAYRAQQNTNRVATEQERAYTTAFTVAKLIDYIGWVLLVLEVALALRFLFKLIGADPANPFASFLYNLTNIFLFIFRGIVSNPTFGSNGTEVFEVTTIIAMVVYGLIYLLLKLLLQTAISRPNEPIA
jgi:hypothetical protein